MEYDPKAGAEDHSSPRNRKELDPFLQNFVRKNARQLAGSFGFSQQDREDIEQRLYLKLAKCKLLQASDTQDPKWKALLAVTVYRHIITMIRDNEAKKRDYRRTCSINIKIAADEGPTELSDTITEDTIPSRRGRQRRSQIEMIDLALDMAECLEEVKDEEERDLCERLKLDSVSQVSRDLGIPRTTLVSWVSRMRCRFQRRGMREHI